MTPTAHGKQNSDLLPPDGGWGYVCIPAVFVLQVRADQFYSQCLIQTITKIAGIYFN